MSEIMFAGEELIACACACACVCACVCPHLLPQGILIHLSISEVECSRGTEDQNPWHLFHLKSINYGVNRLHKEIKLYISHTDKCS